MKNITIILPTYNEEDSISEIKKYMSQVIEKNPDYKWDFLFVNDGSTDNTLNEILKLCSEDTFVI